MAQIVTAEYPVGNVQILAGKVSVELLGRTETFQVSDEPAAFSAGLWWIGERAREFGRPLRARVASSSQSWMVAVDVTGSYEVLDQGAAPVAPGPAASQPTPPRIDEGVHFTEAELTEVDSAVERRDEQLLGLDREAPESEPYDAFDVPQWRAPEPPAAIIPPNNARVAGGYGEVTRHIATASAGRRRWWKRGQGEEAGPDPLSSLTRLTYMVANRKGEAGKTPISVLLAAAFATKRPNDVVLVDLNPVGNLALRTVQSTTATVSDVVAALRELDRLPYASDLDGLMNWQPEGYHAIPSRDSLVIQQEGDEPVLAPRLSLHDFDLLSRSLHANAHVLGLDTGNNDGDEAWQRASELSDVLVVPVKWDPPTCTQAGQMLDDLVKLGRSDLARSAIVVPTWGPAEVVDKGRAKDFEAYFRSKGHRVMPIPPDPHLAGKGVITWARLKPATRDAALALAREVARGR